MIDPIVPPTYRLTPRAVLALSSAIFFGWPKRTFGECAVIIMNMHEPRPLLTGIENLPHSGAYTVVANHYQRDGLWIGWVGGMIAEAIYRIKPSAVPIRVVVTDKQRIDFRGRSVAMPLSGFFLGRIAKIWGMIRMSGDPNDANGRAASLRHILRTLSDGEPILFFPEGDRGNSSGLVEALPGTGTFLALAAKRGAIVPVGIWEEGLQLRGHIAPPLTLTGANDTAIRDQAMTSIGHLLPSTLWGTYRDKITP